MKKLASLLLALVMIMSCFSAMAYTITIENTTTGHTYEAYQIFKGRLSEDGTVLSDIEWGTGVNSATLLAALQDSSDFGDPNPFTGLTTAREVAEQLNGKTNDGDFAKNFAALVGANLAATSGTFAAEEDYKITGLEAGYYLVKDADNSVDGHDSYTRFILEVVDDVTVEPKGTVPTVDKQITNSDNSEAGDFNIGDVINYKLIGTLPSNYADYTEYFYKFTDTLSAGLTYNDDAKVYVVNGETKTDVTNLFTINYSDLKLVVTIDNLKDIESVSASSQIVVEYTATLNSDAVIGNGTATIPGNYNTVDLIFSNDPNFTGNGEDSPTGDTPDDTVVVFTYELDVTKIDGKNNQLKLKGAEFKLRNDEGKWATVENGKVTGWVDTEEAATTLISDENGLFKVAGLEDGVYYLKETKAPDGYNLLTEDIKVTISSTYTEAGVTVLTILVGELAEDNQPAAGDIVNGTVNMEVENNAGTTLPSTGGMGTTILYVGGGILVLAAIVLLIAKRRTAA